MKGPLRVMLILVVAIVVLAAASVGIFAFLRHHKETSHKPAVLSPKQAQQLQVTLPQMTTNLNASGIIQFTLTLQADNKSTEQELNLMQNQIADAVNEIMRQFTSNQLRNDTGLNDLKGTIVRDINRMLQTGHVTTVYFSQLLVQ